MLSEQKVRAFLFYASVIIFLISLPVVLSFSLEYRFNPRTFRFTKTGLVAIKTQPAGASVYLDDKLLDSKTPLTASELMPADYRLRLELDGYYPWFDVVRVNAGEVARLEKIILFPLRPDVKQLNKQKFYSFWIDDEKDTVYYVDQEKRGIFRSDLEGSGYKRVAAFLEMKPPPAKFLLSPDRRKVLYFNRHALGISYLEPYREEAPFAADFVLSPSQNLITNAFWHSDSFHVVLVTDRTVEVLEARPKPNPVTLVVLNKRNASAVYDAHADTLYFVDSQRAADGNLYNNLYKLELNTKLFSLPQFMRHKSNE